MWNKSALALALSPCSLSSVEGGKKDSRAMAPALANKRMEKP